MMGVDTCVKNDCHPEATCTPQLDAKEGEPQYSCSCNAGWEGNGTTCEDANECVDETHECSDTQVCVNELGTYKCVCAIGAVDPDNDGVCERRYADLSPADETSCAVAEDHTMWCWGKASAAGNLHAYFGPHLATVQAAAVRTGT